MSPLAALCAALLAGFLAGGTSAWKVQSWRADAAKAEQLQEAQRIAGQRQGVTAAVDTKHVAAAERIKVVTITQIKEVPSYVRTSDCPMSPGFRVLHDAAAAGDLPDPARIADAAPVPATTVAEATISNYGTCIETAERLTALQGWVKQQQGVR